MTFVLIFVPLAILLAALFCSLRHPARGEPANVLALPALEEPARRHATYFSVIRQAMSAQDLDFLAARGHFALVRRAHRERHRVAVLYLANLRGDFERLLHLASVIAVLSPEVPAAHELERLRLTLRFCWRYRMTRLGLFAGLLLMPQLRGLSEMVAELAFRMELAMKDLSERAAAAADLASTLNRSGLDAA